jgi:arylsulfatase A-like enzyme
MTGAWSQWLGKLEDNVNWPTKRVTASTELPLIEPPRSGTSLILLITSDSVRRDFMGPYQEPGKTGHTTPFINSLAQTGLKYTNAFSHGGGTPESFPSIMASVPPPFRLNDRQVSGRLTVARLLRESGFSTAGFHSNPFLSSAFGYNEGFQEFFDGRPAQLSAFPRSVQLLYSGANLLLNRAPIVDGYQISRRAISWLKTIRGSAFLWVHFMDTHFPYMPYSSEVGLVNSLRNRAIWEVLMAQRVQYRNSAVSQSTRETILKGYRACVERVDRCVSFLLSKASALFDNRLVIFTSDHGESFWEDGSFGHTGLHDRILRVPLILNSNRLAAPAVIRGMVALSDIFPTICSFIDQIPPKGLIGQPMISTKKEVVSSSERIVLCSSIDPPLNRRLVGARGLAHKYIREMTLDSDVPVSEKLVWLDNDSESMDVQYQHPREFAFLRKVVTSAYTQTVATTGVLSERDEQKIRARLRSLGYE